LVRSTVPRRHIYTEWQVFLRGLYYEYVAEMFEE
jgi:hypothetical protein